MRAVAKTAPSRRRDQRELLRDTPRGETWLPWVAWGCASLALAIAGCGGGKFERCGAQRDCDADGGETGLGASGGGANTSWGGDGHGGADSSGGNAATAGSLSAGGKSELGDGGLGADRGNGDAGKTGSCDETASPRAEACLRTESFAVFVTPTGDDRAPGTRAEPLASLERAILAARASGRDVIACAGTYPDAVTLSGAGAVRVYGGFDCGEDWQPSDDKSVIAPEDGPALVVDRARDPVLFQDFELRSADAVTPSASSIAVIVTASERVALHRVTVRAGAGANGAHGADGAYEFPGTDALLGYDGTETAGGAGDACQCPDGRESRRGSGGDPPSETGSDGLPVGTGPGGSGGDPEVDCGSGGTGKRGAPGFDADDALGARTLGALSGASWIPTPGEAALSGAPGQGGGGGAGKPGGGGGSGACGGCGGEGGEGGGGGGASIGILSIDSLVVLERVKIVTSRGGDGGNGGAGQPGMALTGRGGDGFGKSSDGGCDGGAGGPGGRGGYGGGGAGGLSVGVFFQGAAPMLGEGMTFMVGPQGQGGFGNPASGTTDDGVPGVVADTWSIEP